MTREQKYIDQMKALGIYQEIYDPEIKTLARLERELTRAQKEWSQTADAGAPSFSDPCYKVIRDLRAEILQHRDALGLTPKAFKRIAGAQPVEVGFDPSNSTLNMVLEQIRGS